MTVNYRYTVCYWAAYPTFPQVSQRSRLGVAPTGSSMCAIQSIFFRRVHMSSILVGLSVCPSGLPFHPFVRPGMRNDDDRSSGASSPLDLHQSTLSSTPAGSLRGVHPRGQPPAGLTTPSGPGRALAGVSVRREIRFSSSYFIPTILRELL